MSEMWQACPVCRGLGVEPNPPRMDSSAAPHPCGVCKGQRIIGLYDGRPPQLHGLASGGSRDGE